MRKQPLILFLMVVMLAAGCSVLSSDEEPFDRAELRPLTLAEQEVVISDNAFGLKLLQALNEAAPKENIFISPLSISMALGMTLNGADGDTYDAMVETLEKQGLSEEEINQSYQSLIDLLTRLDPKVAVQIANSIWYRQGFAVEPAFLDVNQTFFDAEVRELNFADESAPGEINDWVEDKTEGKIKKIVDRIPGNVVMYLINAIYFKGEWTHPFDKDDTQDAPFHNLDGTTTTVPMMAREGHIP